MPSDDLNLALPHDLDVLVRTINAPLERVASVRCEGAASTFRLTFADGRTLKGRCSASEAEAARTESVLRRLHHPAFPPVLARHRTATLTDWIDGTPLDRLPLTTAIATACGALQGYLHSLPVGTNHPDASSDVRWNTDALHRRVERLVGLGLLQDEEARATHTLLTRHVPATKPVGFIHTDFCSENIVRTDRGDLCVIDNDSVAVGAVGYDLGRTWYRWPMQPSLRHAYLAGYTQHRDCTDFFEHFAYWALAAALAGAIFRLRHHPETAAAAVTRLRLLLRVSSDSGSTGRALLDACDARAPVEA